MKKHSNFLLKISGITMMICCAPVVCFAPPPGNTFEDGNSINIAIISVDDRDAPTQLCPNTKSSEAFLIDNSEIDSPICDEGTYLYKCGNNTLGYKWITSASTENHSYDLTTVSGTTASDYFEQMRGFFAGQLINQAPGSNPDTSENIKAKRDTFLVGTCNPGTVSFTCETCPNNANIPASTVRLQKKCYKQKFMYTNNTNNCNDCPSSDSTFDYDTCSQNVDCYYELTADNNWSVHTIADCYQNEFEDDTGTFEYIQNGTTSASAYCFYGNTISNADFKKYYYGSSPTQPQSNNNNNYNYGGYNSINSGNPNITHSNNASSGLAGGATTR